MRALHLPGVDPNAPPPYSFPSNPPPASSLQYSSTFPNPTPPSHSHLRSSTHAYKVKVSHTALTRGELSWAETLAPERWKPYGGAVPGHDVVGVIDEVYAPANTDADASKAGAKFNKGDRVAGLIGFGRDGAVAEKTIVYEDEIALVEGDIGVSEEEIATVPLSGLSAYQALFTHLALPRPRLSPGGDPSPHHQPRILVTGASGSVGVQVVQLAKAAGCWVVGTCSSKNTAFVIEELGADEVLDYGKYETLQEGFAGLRLDPLDGVVDTVGGKTLLQALSPQIVKDQGRVVTVASPLKAAGPGASEVGETFEQRGGKFTFFIVEPNASQLEVLLQLVGAKKIKGFVDRVLELDNGTKAMERVEMGHVRGKVVLRVGEDGL